MEIVDPLKGETGIRREVVVGCERREGVPF